VALLWWWPDSLKVSATGPTKTLEVTVSEDRYTFREACDSAKDDLDSWIEDNREEFADDFYKIDDTICEIADSATPIYNSTLLEWAAEHPMFALEEPECGPAFDGSPTPINIIAANIFEHIRQELWEYAYARHEATVEEIDQEEEEREQAIYEAECRLKQAGLTLEDL
jgi:hypothetical protein